MKEYDDLLSNWEDSPENFLRWIVDMCGVDINSTTYVTLKETVNTYEELQLWIDLFDGDIDNVTGTTEAYLSCITEKTMN